MAFIFRKTIAFLISLLILKTSLSAAATVDVKIPIDVPTLPFRECWRYSTEELSKFSIASDNLTQIYLPIVGGKLRSIERKTGSLLWSSDLGGEIAAEMVLAGEMLFIVVRDSNEEVPGVTIRALSRLTGVARWQSRIAADRVESVRLVSDDKSITLITGNGKIQTFDVESGRLKSFFDFRERVEFPAVYAKSDDIFINTGHKIIRFSTAKNAPAASAVVKKGDRLLFARGDGTFLVGDLSGKVSLYSMSARKRFWTIRTGAEISDVVETAVGFLLSSNDNFIYHIDAERGRRLWKKRLSARTRGVLADARTGAFNAMAGEQMIFVETATGKIINRISLTGGSLFINRPLVIGNDLFAPTSKGVSAYSSNGCQTKDAPD